MEKKTKKELSKKQRKSCSGGRTSDPIPRAPGPAPAPIYPGVGNPRRRSPKANADLKHAIVNAEKLLFDLNELQKSGIKWSD